MKGRDLINGIAQIFPHAKQVVDLFPDQRDVFVHRRIPSCLAISAIGLRSPKGLTMRSTGMSSWSCRLTLHRIFCIMSACGASTYKSTSPPFFSSCTREPNSVTCTPSPSTAWAVLLMVAIWAGVRRMVWPWCGDCAIN